MTDGVGLTGAASRRTPPILIVNADDYGLTEGISYGILRAHEEGVVTSTSVLAVGPAYGKVSGRLADHPMLGVGIHLAAVGEDPPLLSALEIPTLLNRRGELSRSYKGLIARLAVGAVDPADIRREFVAQIEAVRELGLEITHLDAHQHLHLWPAVGRIVLDLAQQFAIPAVRVTRCRGTAIGPAISFLANRLADRASTAGIAHPEDAAGLEWAGQLGRAKLARALDRLAARGARSCELGVHPGLADDPDRGRYSWGYEWAAEFDALTCPETAALVEQHGFRLGTYRDLPSVTTSHAIEAEAPGPTGNANIAAGAAV